MIRIQSEEGWRLIQHAEHARAAGSFAQRWKNARFEPPKPFTHILDAVVRHDDSWIEEDSNPELSPEGKPSAFSKELIGEYAAFEDIDLKSYLAVRERAAETAAQRDPFAAILISMHTVDLLTNQADLTSLTDNQRRIHGNFVETQQERQKDWKKALKQWPKVAEYATETHFKRGFRFLQVCDQLSLLVCSQFGDRMQLRHEQPTADGSYTPIEYVPFDDNNYTCSPWPFDQEEFTIKIRYRHVSSDEFSTNSELKREYANADTDTMQVKLTKE